MMSPCYVVFNQTHKIDTQCVFLCRMMIEN